MRPEFEQKIEEIWLQIDAAAPPLEPVNKCELERITRELSQLAELCCEASAWYALGYAWYLHPDRRHSALVQERTREALLKSVTIDPQFAHAWLYLGHHHYDLADYERA